MTEHAEFTREKEFDGYLHVTMKSRTAVAALVDLVVHQQSGSVTLVDICWRLKRSTSHMEQIFKLLRRSGIVEGVRGPHGGYRLARPAEEVTVADIVQAINRQGAAPSSALVRFCHGAAAADSASRVVDDLWNEQNSRVMAFLASVSLRDLADGTVGVLRH